MPKLEYEINVDPRNINILKESIKNRSYNLISILPVFKKNKGIKQNYLLTVKIPRGENHKNMLVDAFTNAQATKVTSTWGNRLPESRVEIFKSFLGEGAKHAIIIYLGTLFPVFAITDVMTLKLFESGNHLELNLFEIGYLLLIASGPALAHYLYTIQSFRKRY